MDGPESGGGTRRGGGPPRWRLPLRRRILYGFLSTVALLAALEGSAAVLERQFPRQRTLPTPAPGQDQGDFQAKMAAAQLPIPLQPDETLGWTLPPHAVRVDDGVTIRTNTLGLRGPEVAPRAPGELRILTTGDSSIYGFRVAERDVFSSVAARILAERWGRPVVAWIGGIPGYDSSQSLEQLRNVIRPLDPDYVVIGNLWSDLYRNDARSVARTEIRDPMRTFATWRVGTRLLAPWLDPLRIRYIDSLSDVGSGDDVRVDIRRYLANLDAMATLVEESGARLVFLGLPAPMDFDVVPVPATVGLYRAGMAEVARNHGARYLEGPAVFRNDGASLGFFIDQVHPSARGHQLLGEALAEVLEGDLPVSGTGGGMEVEAKADGR